MHVRVPVDNGQGIRRAVLGIGRFVRAQFHSWRTFFSERSPQPDRPRGRRIRLSRRSGRHHERHVSHGGRIDLEHRVPTQRVHPRGSEPETIPFPLRHPAQTQRSEHARSGFHPLVSSRDPPSARQSVPRAGAGDKGDHHDGDDDYDNDARIRARAEKGSSAAVRGICLDFRAGVCGSCCGRGRVSGPGACRYRGTKLFLVVQLQGEGVGWHDCCWTGDCGGKFIVLGGFGWGRDWMNEC